MAAISDIIGEQQSTSIKREDVLEEDRYDFMNFYKPQDIVDGLQVCYKILEKLQIVEGSPSESVSPKASALGERFATVIIESLKEWDFYEEEELFLPEENILGDDVEVQSQTSSCSASSISSSQSTDDSGEEYQPEFCKKSGDYISLETKMKILKMAREHPKWSLKTIQKSGGSALKRKSDLKRWENQIKKGRGIREKFDQINKMTYDRFVEARQQMQPVSRRIIQQWASQAAAQYKGPEFSFKASKSWVTKFKASHSISKRKVKPC